MAGVQEGPNPGHSQEGETSEFGGNIGMIIRLAHSRIDQAAFVERMSLEMS